MYNAPSLTTGHKKTFADFRKGFLYVLMIYILYGCGECLLPLHYNLLLILFALFVQNL